MGTNSVGQRKTRELILKQKIEVCFIRMDMLDIVAEEILEVAT